MSSSRGFEGEMGIISSQRWKLQRRAVWNRWVNLHACLFNEHVSREGQVYAGCHFTQVLIRFHSQDKVLFISKSNLFVDTWDSTFC